MKADGRRSRGGGAIPVTWRHSPTPPQPDSNGVGAAVPATVAAAPTKLVRFNSCVMEAALPLEKRRSASLAGRKVMDTFRAKQEAEHNESFFMQVIDSPATAVAASMRFDIPAFSPPSTSVC
ncbi:hypothetical protein SAZ11_04740 [Streptomyces sp. FXJ1.4098]|nr:hypothetical protein [Streptomyces sp. FXJ1.4098]